MSSARTGARTGAREGARVATTGAGCGCGPAPLACEDVAPAGVTPLVPADDAAAEAVFKALASAPRRQLLRIIAANTSADGACCPAEVCACQLADALELAPSTISHHMSVLVSAGLVSAEKRGLWVYYGLRRDVLATVAGQIAGL